MPRNVEQQVVVITGASSGIGRETARAFGERGASVVLAARNAEALEQTRAEVERLGGQALVVVTDVAEWPQVERLAQAAVDRFGRIDTWVNNAAVSVYGSVDQLTIEELDRVIQVDLMGQIYGMKAALPHMKRAGQGTIVNVGSVESRRAIPLHAPYAAAKHAVKGFTDALRMELEHQKVPIGVTLIMPASINTPFFTHSRSKLGVKPKGVPPFYDPRVVADAIVSAAENPRREIVVGGAGKMLALMELFAPGLADRTMVAGGLMFEAQKSDQPDDGQDNLFAPMPASTYAVRGEFGAMTRSTSLYTRLFALHPRRSALAIAATLLGTAAVLRRVAR